MEEQLVPVYREMWPELSVISMSGGKSSGWLWLEKEVLSTVVVLPFLVAFLVGVVDV
jgi:hypothetical protein